MQVSFDTDKPGEVALVRMILGIAAGMPAAPAAPVRPTPVTSGPPLPPGAPEGAYWSYGAGGLMLLNKDGSNAVLPTP